MPTSSLRRLNTKVARADRTLFNIQQKAAQLKTRVSAVQDKSMILKLHALLKKFVS